MTPFSFPQHLSHGVTGRPIPLQVGCGWTTVRPATIGRTRMGPAPIRAWLLSARAAVARSAAGPVCAAAASRRSCMTPTGTSGAVAADAACAGPGSAAAPDRRLSASTRTTSGSITSDHRIASAPSRPARAVATRPRSACTRTRATLAARSRARRRPARRRRDGSSAASGPRCTAGSTRSGWTGVEAAADRSWRAAGAVIARSGRSAVGSGAAGIRAVVAGVTAATPGPGPAPVLGRTRARRRATRATTRLTSATSCAWQSATGTPPPPARRRRRRATATARAAAALAGRRNAAARPAPAAHPARAESMVVRHPAQRLARSCARTCRRRGVEISVAVCGMVIIATP